MIKLIDKSNCYLEFSQDFKSISIIFLCFIKKYFLITFNIPLAVKPRELALKPNLLYLNFKCSTFAPKPESNFEEFLLCLDLAKRSSADFVGKAGYFIHLNLIKD